MVLMQILKRKDASSVVVAIVLAMIINSLLMTTIGMWSMQLVTSQDSGPNQWNNIYLPAIVGAVLQLVALEVLCWVYVWLNSIFKNNKK